MYWYQPERKLLAASQKVLIWLSPVKHFYHSLTWRDRKHASQISEWSNNWEEKFTTAYDCIEIWIIQMCWCEATMMSKTSSIEILPSKIETISSKLVRISAFTMVKWTGIAPPFSLRNNYKIRSKTEISKPHLWWNKKEMKRKKRRRRGRRRRS